MVDYVALEQQAKDFAIDMHRNQQYNGGEYQTHLQHVRDVLYLYRYDGPLFVAAWLHDIVENNPHSDVMDRLTCFPSNIVGMVWAVSGFGTNRKARNSNQYEKLQRYPLAIILKQADRIANAEVSSSNKETGHFKMYKKEYPEFKSKLQPYGGDALMWRRLDELFE